MNAQDFIDTYGRERAEEVSRLADCKFSYFLLIAKGKRRPSVELADKLIEASDYKLDFVSLLRSKKQPA